MEITKELYDKLNELGIIPNEVRKGNIAFKDKTISLSVGQLDAINHLTNLLKFNQ